MVGWCLLEEFSSPAAPVCVNCLLAAGALLRSGCCVLWCHILQAEGSCFILQASILNLWPSVCFLTFLSTQRAKIVCICPLPTYFFSIFFHYSFSLDSNVFSKVLVYSLGVIKWVLLYMCMFHKLTPTSNKSTGKQKKTSAFLCFPHLWGWVLLPKRSKDINDKNMTLHILEHLDISV